MNAPPGVLVKAISGIGGLYAVWQAVPVDTGIGFINELSKAGIIGFLAVAVWIVRGDSIKQRAEMELEAKTLRERFEDRIKAKDELLLTLYKDQAAVMATTHATLQKMGDTLCHMDEVLQRMDTVRQVVKGA